MRIRDYFWVGAYRTRDKWTQEGWDSQQAPAGMANYRIAVRWGVLARVGLWAAALVIACAMGGPLAGPVCWLLVLGWHRTRKGRHGKKRKR